MAGLLVVAGLSLSACSEVETEAASGYEPAKLEPVGPGSDRKRVTFTAEGARRTGLRTAPVLRRGEHTIVPYAALVYDPEGKTYVYTSRERLSFVREEVAVDRIEGNRVLVVDGPPAGTEVVTVGAAEVYGTELEISGGH
ncbi:MAG: hypothetical protein M3304_00110 [Actinomycetota bacterium]|nr:hypothetical protein [Actinomycetota bacterium]